MKHFLAVTMLLLTACFMGQAEPPAPKVATDPLSDPAVFRTIVRRQGDDAVHTYRIPGLATTSKGTLIAVFDLRHNGGGDLPGNIDVGMARSTDQGKTWSKTQAILDFDKDEKDAKGNGVGDPAILVDHRTGQILVAALWSHGNRGWNGSGPGLTPQETGQLVLTRSRDDGLTWSEPINISQKITGRDPKWRLLFNGPGNGIQLRDGTLVFAAQFRDGAGAPHSCFIYSSDGGDNWTISAPAVPDKPHTSEAQIAELSDGSLLLTMRNESRSGQRVWARYTWKDDLSKGTWSDPWLTVPDPTCMASLIRHSTGPLLFSNPNSTKQRVAITIRTSHDDGRNWSEGKLLDARAAMYSCMTELKDGSIGVLYEGIDDKGKGALHFARFPLAWVTKPQADKKQSSLRLGLPFSAVAFCFGHLPERELDAPVGVIHMAVGGSPAKEWVAQDSLMNHDELGHLAKGDWLENKAMEPWCINRAKENDKLPASPSSMDVQEVP